MLNISPLIVEAMEFELDEVALRIAGRLALSSNPGREMKLLREKAGINQNAIAKEMGISPSVLSDYENGRRKSPGVGFIKRYVTALLKLDRQGARVFAHSPPPEDRGAILDIREFEVPVPASGVLEALRARVLAGEEMLDRPIYGYTVLDSIRTIYMLTGSEFYRIFGRTSERALVFTKVGLGRSPMVAVRVSHLKPRVVVLHGPKQVDPLAIQLAKLEGVVLALSELPNEGDIVVALSKLGKGVQLT